MSDTRGAQSSEGPRVVEVGEQMTVVVAGKVPIDGLREFFDAAFHELGRRIDRGELRPTGPALSLYHSEPGPVVELEVGFPVAEQVASAGSVVVGRIPATRAVTCTHHGDYDGLSSSWERLRTWAQERHLRLGAPLWEVYVTEPRPGDDPLDMVTELYWAVEA
ncbi:GyrI-like domain-containing protein [Kocuria turfanensis]|uniref:Transcriptional regulator n=1 Tax=Kocuria turfanensis TaxID=388357 RepID=A0A512IEB9_9MICC|nr:GyrI-like domain-containing protein [Kocuria turfanensis]GEO96038.1 transcriptional regulator [Kocuria turfanensis]